MYQAAAGSFAGWGGGAEFWVVGKIGVDGMVGMETVTPVMGDELGNWLVMSVNQSSGGG